MVDRHGSRLLQLQYTFSYENNDVQSNRSDIFIGCRRRPSLHLHAITNHLDHIFLKLSDVFTYKLPAYLLYVL